MRWGAGGSSSRQRPRGQPAGCCRGRVPGSQRAAAVVRDAGQLADRYRGRHRGALAEPPSWSWPRGHRRGRCCGCCCGALVGPPLWSRPGSPARLLLCLPGATVGRFCPATDDFAWRRPTLLGGWPTFPGRQAVNFAGRRLTLPRRQLTFPGRVADFSGQRRAWPALPGGGRLCWAVEDRLCRDSRGTNFIGQRYVHMGHTQVHACV